MGDPALLDALGASQRLGMLGDRPITEIVEHARAFVDALASTTGTVVDLGSGGGIPGLVIARARPDLHLVLVDRRATRTDHLRRLVLRLGLERVEVLTTDARDLPNLLPALVEGVVARGFGPPAETLRRAAPLLTTGGVVIVSEPPVPSADRWPAEVLHAAGLAPLEHVDRRVACFRRLDVSRGTRG
jgi:16S rRNA (guanine527-N7)-methyltransferase